LNQRRKCIWIGNIGRALCLETIGESSINPFALASEKQRTVILKEAYCIFVILVLHEQDFKDLDGGRCQQIVLMCLHDCFAIGPCLCIYEG